MGDKTHIQWTEHTYNPWQGCHKVSQGCKFCYMFRDKTRYGQDPNLVVRSKPATFNAPLRWASPGLVFTCSWSDFFIPEADSWRAEAWAVIKATPHLMYQVLTKRPERIAEHLPADWGEGYPNVALGVSVENQRYADERIPLLLKTPAQVRFLSCEPLLEQVNLKRFFAHSIHCTNRPMGLDAEQRNRIWAANNLVIPCNCPKLHWVITGGESGSKAQARPAEIDWFINLRDQCQAVGVAFFHKQNGGYAKDPVDGSWGGRKLDGVEYNEFPEQFKPFLPSAQVTQG